MRLGLIAILLASPAPLVAKVSGMTLAEMVKGSPVIVYGETVEVGSSAARNAAWVAFKALLVVRGPQSLRKQTIELCNSAPRMMDYPDLRKWSGGVGVLFLRQTDQGCFDLVHGHVSVVDVRDNLASTAAIEGQPKWQPLGLFFKKVRGLIAK